MRKILVGGILVKDGSWCGAHGVARTSRATTRCSRVNLPERAHQFHSNAHGIPSNNTLQECEPARTCASIPFNAHGNPSNNTP
jgi:hypothetical protein